MYDLILHKMRVFATFFLAMLTLVSAQSVFED